MSVAIGDLLAVEGGRRSLMFDEERFLFLGVIQAPATQGDVCDT